MLMQLTSLQGLPIASLHDEARVGSVLDAVVDPDTGELVGFWVKPQGLFARRKALSSRDIIGYDPLALVVQQADALVDAAEIRSFTSIARQHHTWLGKRVETADGEGLGAVSDLVLNLDLEVLAKIEVSSFLWPQRIISREAILRVTPKAIIVQADFASVSPVGSAVQTATS